MTHDPSNPAPLLRTALHDLHVAAQARMVPFAGYDMPVQYPAGLLAEHAHCRAAAALFDVSHMGQIVVSGDQAAQALEHALPIDAQGMAVGQQRYALMLNDAGGIIDDLMVTRRAHDWLLVVNGACKHTDLAHLQRVLAPYPVHLQPQFGHALLALQGPQAAAALAPLLPPSQALVFMTGAPAEWQGHTLHVTRSGYTGEDGFEISAPAEVAQALAQALLAQPMVQWAGLGARNALRLEAGLCLYGNDIDATTTPSEAGLVWSIQKVRRPGGERAGQFIGAATVLAQLAGTQALTRRRVGLLGLARVPVREGCPLLEADGAECGQVVSGLLSPQLNQPIAMAYVRPEVAIAQTALTAMVRGKPVPMQVAAMPFVPHRYFRG
jgi:aminomethyltransferase